MAAYHSMDLDLPFLQRNVLLFWEFILLPPFVVLFPSPSKKQTNCSSGQFMTQFVLSVVGIGCWSFDPSDLDDRKGRQSSQGDNTLSVTSQPRTEAELSCVRRCHLKMCQQKGRGRQANDVTVRCK